MAGEVLADMLQCPVRCIMVTMSEKEVVNMVKDMKAWGKKIAATPETARKALLEMGIIDKNGKLSKNYGG